MFFQKVMHKVLRALELFVIGFVIYIYVYIYYILYIVSENGTFLIKETHFLKRIYGRNTLKTSLILKITIENKKKALSKKSVSSNSMSTVPIRTPKI